MGLISACQSIVPATTPLQLNYTPSPAITVTDSQIDAGWFVFDYPDNWRVITNIASEPLHLILVSPDDSLIIHIEDAWNGCFVLEVTPEVGHVRWDECIGDDTAGLYIWGEQISELETEFEAFFYPVVNSIAFR